LSSFLWIFFRPEVPLVSWIMSEAQIAYNGWLSHAQAFLYICHNFNYISLDLVMTGRWHLEYLYFGIIEEECMTF
jgi:hypothetical protein